MNIRATFREERTRNFTSKMALVYLAEYKSAPSEAIVPNSDDKMSQVVSNVISDLRR